MLRAKLIIFISILLVGVGLQPAQAYPPSGLDYVTTSAVVELYPDAGGALIETVIMDGTATIFRSDPIDDGGGGMMIETRMDFLLLRGYSITQGDSMFVTLNPDSVSNGAITQVEPGIDFPAESFFDVFFKLTIGSEADLAKSGANAGYGFKGEFNYDLEAQQGNLRPTERVVPGGRLQPPLENLVKPVPPADKDRQGGVSLQLTGAGTDGVAIFPGSPFDIEIWMDNYSGTNILGVSNGFRIYSPDGASWTVPVTTMDPTFCSFFDLFCGTVESVDGISEDTVLLGAVAMFTGIPSGWYGMAASIATEVDAAQVNKTLCVDSTFVPPSGTWVWNTPQGSFPPEWMGPYCWDIVPLDTCDYIEYGGDPYYYWKLPDPNDIPEWGERFTSIPNQCCTLKTASILVYGAALFGSPGLDVTVYDDDGTGLPGTALATITIPAADMPAGMAYVSADFSGYNLVFCDQEFHVGVQMYGDPTTDTANVVSDDGTFGEIRSWASYQGFYYTMSDLFGTDVNWKIGVELCCSGGPVIGVNFVPPHMLDTIWQLPPWGRVYQDPRRTPVINVVTGDTMFWVTHEHVVDPPDPGEDTIPTIGIMPVWVGPNPPAVGQDPNETITLTGTAIVSRGPVYYNTNEQMEIETEIVSMNLTGTSTLFGDAFLTLPYPAIGLVTQVIPGDDFFPAESFFDVFYEVDFPAIGQTVTPLDPEVAPRMETVIEALPPVDNQYTQVGNAHPVHDIQNPGVIIGWVLPIHWVDPPPQPRPPDTIPTVGLMPYVVGPTPPAPDQWPDETIVLYGDAIIQYGAEYDDTLADLHIIETEMVQMDLTGNSQTLGPAILSLPQSAVGQVSYPAGGPDFPAESFFDVYYEVELPDQGQTLAPEGGNSVNMSTTISSIPPVNNKYNPDGWHPIVDLQTPTIIVGWVQPIHWVDPDTCAEQDPGDLNGDGVITIPDLMYLIQYVNCTGPPPAVLANADVNGDCVVDQADVDYMQAFLYSGGPPPVDCTCIIPRPPVCCTGWTPGVDTLQFSSFEIEYYDPSDTDNPVSVLYAFGVQMIVQRGAPYEVSPGIWRMDTDILQFSGSGNSPLTGGAFTLGLDPGQTSSGWIQHCDSCNDNWAESAWDIKYEITTSLPFPNGKWHGTALMELPCDANWDPGDPFTPPDGNSYNDPRHVPIYNENGELIGYVWKEHRVDSEPMGACCNMATGGCRITTAIDCQSTGDVYMGDGTTCSPNPCICTDWTTGMDTISFSAFEVDLYDPSDTTTSLGTVTAFGVDMVVMRYNLHETAPGNGIWQLDTRVLSLTGAGNNGLVGGAFSISLDPNNESAGYIRMCDSCNDYWAESFFDIRYEINTSLPFPDDVYRGQALMALPCSEGWNPFPDGEFAPPYGHAYVDPRKVPITDQNGEIVGYVWKQHRVDNEPLGACCDTITGACRITSAARCVGPNEEYQGDNVPCDPNPCPLCTHWTAGPDTINYSTFSIDLYDQNDNSYVGKVYAFGTQMIVQRGAPFEATPDIWRMNTTIVQFGGVGNDPLLGGPFTLALDPAQVSDGYIQQCDSCDDNWAESHWTIHYVLVTSQSYPDDTLRGIAQMDLDCDAGWNPGDPFTPPDGNSYNDPRHVPIYDNNGNIIGYTVKQHSVYADPQEGACCYGTDCVVMPGLLCVEEGGKYQGDNVPCDPNPCSCCKGEIRGNIDYSDPDIDAAVTGIDISDLVYLVDYMFNQGPPPPCWAEANSDCSCCGPDGIPDTQDDVDISDLVWLVDYMFTGGAGPCRCDCTDCVRDGSSSKIGQELIRKWSTLADPTLVPPYCAR